MYMGHSRPLGAGTEAAAVTAVIAVGATAFDESHPRPFVLEFNRPFAFGIQHLSTLASLFLGQVYSPI